MQRKSKLPCRVMEYMRKDFTVAVISCISGETPAHEKLPDRDKRGILAVCHGAESLYEKRVAGVQINGVVSCSAFLGKYDFCLEAVSVEAEEFSDLKRVPHFFQGKHIRVEGEDKQRLFRLPDLPQGKTRVIRRLSFSSTDLFLNEAD